MHDQGEEELINDAMETGTDTNPKVGHQNGQNALQRNIPIATPVTSIEDYETIQTFSDEDDKEDYDDT